LQCIKRSLGAEAEEWERGRRSGAERFGSIWPGDGSPSYEGSRWLACRRRLRTPILLQSLAALAGVLDTVMRRICDSRFAAVSVVTQDD
jgi:hypothetical protein